MCEVLSLLLVFSDGRGWGRRGVGSVRRRRMASDSTEMPPGAREDVIIHSAPGSAS